MSETIIERAVAWHRMQDDPDCDWNAFTQWLEADPAHRAAFDEIALLDRRVDERREALAHILPPEPVVAARPRRRGLWAGGIAAGLALAVAVPQLFFTAAPGADYRTEPGKPRDIALADGSRIALAGGSHLHVAGAQQDRLTLEGRAYFDIPHRPGRTMTIEAGGQSISDIGTRFDVLATGDMLRVGVAEGVLSVKPASGSTAIHLSAGRQLVVQGNRGETGPTDPGGIGGWRQGRLVYEGVPLALVVADLQHYGHKRLKVAPDIARRPFSGVLVVGDGSGLVGQLVQFMDLETLSQGDAILLRARGD